MIENAKTDARLTGNHVRLGGKEIRFYAGIRLVDGDGVPFGTLSVLDVESRNLQPHQADGLIALKDQIAAHLESRRKLLQLTSERDHQERLLDLTGGLQHVLDAIPASVAYWDTHLVNRFVNTTYLKWFGKKRSEVEGKNARELTGEDSFGRNLKRISAVLNGKPQTFEKSFIAFDGKKRDAIFKYIPDIQNGKVEGFFAMIFDNTERRMAEAELRKTQSQLRTVIDNIPAMIGYWTSELKNEFANKAYFDSFGLSPDAILGMSMEQVVGNLHFEQNAPHIKMVLNGNTECFDRTLVSAYGKISHCQATFIPDIERGKVKGFYSLETDITHRREAELSLMEEKERGRVTLNSIGDAVITTDCEGLITFLNPRAEKLTGWLVSEAKGIPANQVICLIEGPERHQITDLIDHALVSTNQIRDPKIFRLRDRENKEYEVEGSASHILDMTGNPMGAVLVLHDVSDTNAIAQRMAHLARHDSLTNLPNRLLLHERLEDTMEKVSRAGSKFALVFLDVDHFKNINDSMGHAVGDELLRAVSDRLSSAVSGVDTVSRQGGDEFIVLLNSVDSADHAGFVVQQIVKSISAPYHLKMIDNAEYKLSITVSAGITMFPDDGVDLDTLMRRADVAMYLAKQAGRNRYQFFTPELDHAVMLRHSWLQDMREAIDNGEFIVFYQPKVSTKDRSIVGVEALVRWEKANGEMIAPGDFIPLAEESGLIVGIGAQVLYEACRQCVRWEAAGSTPIPVAVNVSAVQLADPSFVSFVETVLSDTEIRPDLLELEITESSIMADVDKAAIVLYQLRDLGVKISLDDFGTGYSSLSYLRRFPLDCLKIDRSFVSDLTTNASTAAIMKTICNLGKTLNLQIIAEGVETEGQAQLLCSLHCDSMQGYLFSKPVRGEVIGKMLPSATISLPRAA